MIIVQHEKYKELIPEDKYIVCVADGSIFEGLCAEVIDENEYEDIDTEFAEQIMQHEFEQYQLLLELEEQEKED